MLLVSIMHTLPSGAATNDTVTTLRIGMVQSIDSLNPFMGVNDNAYIFYGLVYDYLICLDENLQPKPNLATSWNIVPDVEPYGSAWQYNLSQNAYWHDGEQVTAEDVDFTFNYQIGDEWHTMWAYQPYTLLIDHVVVVDEFTVRLFFAKDGVPVSCSFGDSLMMPIIPEHYWRDMSPVEASFSHENPKPLGSGPFMCSDHTYDEFLRGDRLILYRHEDYHGGPEYGKEIQFDRLILEFYLEPTALFTDFQRGAIDIAQFDAPTYTNLLDWLSKNPTDTIGTHSGRKCTGFSVEIGICMKPDGGPNQVRLDPAIRQALAHGTDKQFICDHIYKGFADLGSTIIPPVFPEWYWEPSEDDEYYFDMDKANEILDEAGYIWNGDHTLRYAPKGHPFNPANDDTDLVFNMIIEQEIIEDRAVGMFLIEEWADLGILIEPVYVSPALWGTIVYGGEYDLTLTYWSGDPDPNYLLFTQTTDSLGGWSENWYSSEDYDENYTKSVLEIDPEKRLEYVINCQELMYRDSAFIVYAYPYECTAWRNDHFSGWGDWTAHPGRALSNFWTANDLYFDLVPELTDEPPYVILDNVAGPAGMPLEVTAYAEDPEGVSMTYRMDFGDGSNVTGDVPSDGELSVEHSYDSPGEYILDLTVSDETSGTRQSSTAVIIGAGGNAPPSNLRVAPSAMKGEKDSEITFTLSGRDYEGDPISLELDFDDDSSAYTTTVQATSDGFELTVTHIYDLARDYSVALTASDSHNTSTAVFVLTVAEPAADEMPVMLLVSAVAVIMIAVIALTFVRKRKAGPGKEEEDVRLP